ncbi:MAG: acetyl-CoA C-acetyltransferase [Microscillaceae bacterium]|jgi:acetyl-CoA C-acetyltransferase|nr:acetyl-CoA C-acetyltransferase [Microscillaceae bacterium]
MNYAYIYDAVRTPRGVGKPEKGALSRTKPIDLLATLYHALQNRNSLNTSEIEEVILGCNTVIGEQGANIAKISALYAGWSAQIAGMTVSSFCTSGLEAFNTGAARIMSGMETGVVVGGVESMSRIPMYSDAGAWFQDSEVRQAVSYIHMGISADLIATLEGFTRAEIDNYAFLSQQKAALATQKGYFQKSLIPIRDSEGKVLLADDENIRPDTSLEKLAQFAPIFADDNAAHFDKIALKKYPNLLKINHLHHIGTAPALADAAALLLLGSAEKGKSWGLKPRARVRGFANYSVEPVIMLTAPAEASRKALKNSKLQVEDIDLFEINESFSAIVLKYMRDLNLSPERVNVNGGAIAMGHPLGATGGILLSMVLDELERQDKQFGLCTICGGAGIATATVIERV